MSITRQDLERSSERLATSLSCLQQDNAKQQKIIEDTLFEVQQEQTSNEQLLHSDWSNQSDDPDTKSKSKLMFFIFAFKLSLPDDIFTVLVVTPLEYVNITEMMNW